jgi:repressor LexA
MAIGERIKNARIKKGLTQEELAGLLGYKSKSSVAHIENGRDIPRAMVVKLAQVLDTTPAHLMGWDDASEPQPTIQTSGKLLGTDTAPFHPDQMTPIPVVGKVAAGYNCLAEQYIEGYALADPDSLTDGYDYFWLRVTGDSMEPDIREGDLVLVRVQEAVESGECAVVLVDEEDGLVKDIEIGKDHVTLCSKNPNYPPRVFVREEANRVRIVGKVVELKRMM